MPVKTETALEAVCAALAADAPAEIARAEAAYNAQIEAAAQKIQSNAAKSAIVLLSGPSGSGKTTTAHRIEKAIEGDSDICHYISMDNYFRSWDDPAFPYLPNGKPDLDDPACVDLPLMEEHFSALDEGRPIDIPVYDFGRHARNPERTIHLDIKPGDICIFEGIHALNPMFTERHPSATGIFVSPGATFTYEGKPVCPPQLLRLMRRACRDYLFRSASLAYTLSLWTNVVESEKKHVLPFREKADITIDTSISYELSALAPTLRPLLETLPSDAPLPELSAAMRRGLGAAGNAALPREIIPKDSLLREFIGN